MSICLYITTSFSCFSLVELEHLCMCLCLIIKVPMMHRDEPFRHSFDNDIFMLFFINQFRGDVNNSFIIVYFAL